MLNPIPTCPDHRIFSDGHSSSTFSISLPLTDSPHINMAIPPHSDEDIFRERPLFNDPQPHPEAKEARRIPFRSLGALPSMRTPPADLYQVSRPKRPCPDDECPSSFSSPLSLHSTRRPTPIHVSSNLISLPPIGFERRQREDSLNSVVVPNRTASLEKPIPTLPPLPPGLPLASRKSLSQIHETGTGPSRFLHVLAVNKRKNPHAPSLVSKFNPLRDCVPPFVWTNRSFPLTSARFRTPLSLLPLRSRSECDWATRDGRKTKQNYLTKVFLHCHACQHDTLGNKLLTINHVARQLHQLLRSPPGPIVLLDDDDDDPDAMEIDDDLLDSPLLQDCDDFDDFSNSPDGDKALLIGGPGVGVSHLTLF